MRVTTGTVVAGRIEVPGETFTEGQKVTVLSSEGDESFRLGPKEEAALLEAMADADRGETIPAEEVLRSLRRRI
jgi:hypothetical protein